MPDITMCLGGDCPLKKDCYRYRVNPCYCQSIMTPPFKDGSCEMFYNIDKDFSIRSIEEIDNAL